MPCLFPADHSEASAGTQGQACSQVPWTLHISPRKKRWLHHGSNQHSTVTRQMWPARAPAQTAGGCSASQPCSKRPFNDHGSGCSLPTSPSSPRPSSALEMKPCTVTFLPVMRWGNSPHISGCAGLILRHLNLRSPLVAQFGRLRKCDLVRGSVSLEMGFESSKTWCHWSLSCFLFTVRDVSSQLPSPVQACYHTSCHDGDGFLLCNCKH